jgi:hypothetical protein
MRAIDLKPSQGLFVLETRDYIETDNDIQKLVDAEYRTYPTKREMMSQYNALRGIQEKTKEPFLLYDYFHDNIVEIIHKSAEIIMSISSPSVELLSSMNAVILTNSHVFHTMIITSIETDSVDYNTHISIIKSEQMYADIQDIMLTLLQQFNPLLKTL